MNAGRDIRLVAMGDLFADNASKSLQHLKVAKPDQDMRFDVPAIGLTTLEVMIEAGAKVLAFEAKKTIVIDRAELVKRSNEHKICLMAKEF